MPMLQTMEYLGRLGLVPRKIKKDRVAPSSLPSQVADSKQTRCTGSEESSCKPPPSIKTASRPLKTGTNFSTIKEPNPSTAHVTELAHTQQAGGFVEIRGTSAAVDIVDMADSFFPRTSISGQEAFIDVEFLEYEQRVQAREQALGAPGGRHAWKTLIFWKRRRTTCPANSTGRPFVSASATPLHVPSRRSYHGRGVTPAMVPLYMSDGFNTSSIRAWCEPLTRGSGKLSSRGPDAEFCNMSPYVPLGGQPRRLPAAPLYLV